MTAVRAPADRDAAEAVRAVRWPGVAAGVGLGAFLDGIVLHQVLGWHHLVVAHRSADDLAGLQRNTFWDGVFHLAAWAVVAGAVYWLAANGAAARTAGPRRLTGLLLAGWGLFDLVDQVVFHLLLSAHHIRMVDEWLVYDAAYTVLGLALVVVGLRLALRQPYSAGRSGRATSVR
ncbi:MAG TPA: DUF2243 domain-containing protein [Egibacteraceae bacterium]